MSQHYVWKIKVLICDKLRTRSVMVSVLGISKLGLMDLIFVDSGGKDQRRLLSRRAPVVAVIARDARRVRRFLHLSTRHMRFLEQLTPAFIPPDLWPPNSTDLNPVDYKIWGDIQ